jgi:hypothetical protein
MMADTGTGRILPTEVISPIQSYDRGAGSLHEDAGALRPERTLSVGQGVRKKGRGKQESAQPEMIVVVEQWICLVLGLVCMGFEMWGICRKPEEDALSAHIAWLGSLSTPTLRVRQSFASGWAQCWHAGDGRISHRLSISSGLKIINALFRGYSIEWKRLPKYWMWPRLVGPTLSNLTMLELPERKNDRGTSR